MSKRRVWTGSVWRGRGLDDIVIGGGGTPGPGAAAVGAATYTAPVDAVHVAKTGNDTTGAGTEANPYLTIAKGVSMATSGSKTVVVHAGRYNEGANSGSATYGFTVSAGVTVQAASGEAVWMEGVTAKTGWSVSGSKWVAAHAARYDNSPTFGRGASEDPRTGWQWVNPLYPCAAWASQVIIRTAFGDQVLQPVPTPADVVAGTFSFDATYPYTATSGVNNQWVQVTTNVYIGNDPTGQTVLITNKSAAMLLYGNMKGVGVHYYGSANCDWGVVSCRTNAHLENVHILDNTGMGLSGLSPNIDLNYCTVSRNGSLGIHGDYNDNFAMHYCLVTENDNRHFNYAPACAGLKLTRANGVLVEYSQFDGNYCNQIWTDVSVANLVMVGNDVINGERRGLVFETSDTVLLVNNIFANNGGDGLYFEPSDKLHVWNNVIHHNGWGVDRFTSAALNGFGIRNVNGDRKPPPGPSSICTAPSSGWTEYSDPRRTYPDANMTWECQDFRLFNNVISDNKTRTVTYMEDLVSPYELSWKQTNPQTGGNLYQHSASVQYKFVGTKADHTGHNIMSSLTSVRSTATAEGTSTQEVGSAETTTSPVDANNLPTSAAQALVTPTAMPADVATAAGVSTGYAVLGAWR